jgi:deazaflavin-dependent oxidoreductase (nitroreductase family)
MAKRPYNINNITEDFKDNLQDIGRQFGILMNKGMAAVYGAGGYRFMGNQFMTITTTGRKSGQPRTTPIGYVEAGNYIYAVTKGGPQISNWYKNVQSNPKVTLRIGEKVLTATGEVLQDPSQVRQVLRLFLKHRPGFSRFFQVAPDARDEELDRIVPNWRAVRFQVKR